jgi:choline dehydrogenase
MATRLLLDGPRVRGVEVMGPTGSATIEADHVVLSAGTYQTPHLLLLSGIGPPDKIEDVGLVVHHRLDGVGENFQDHAVVYLTYRGSGGLREEYLIPKVRLFVASSAAVDHGDLHILLHPSIRVEGMAPLLPVSIRLLEDRGRGRLWLASADPADLPAIDPAILRAPEDRTAMLNGMRFARDFLAHPRMAEFYGELVSPDAADDASWLDHAVGSHITYNHATGTCRFGPEGDSRAVVGPALRVHGLDNLWLADMSVIPVIPHAPTNLTAYLVGAIAARNLVAAGA